MRTDGSDNQPLYDDRCHSLNVIGDWMYFGNSSDTNTFWKMTTRGTEGKRIVSQIGGCWNIAGDWVYYRSNDNPDKAHRIYKHRLDGTVKQQRLAEDLSLEICVAGDWVYYMQYADNSSKGGSVEKTYRVYRMRTDGSDRKLQTGPPEE